MQEHSSRPASGGYAKYNKDLNAIYLVNFEYSYDEYKDITFFDCDRNDTTLHITGTNKITLSGVHTIFIDQCADLVIDGEEGASLTADIQGYNGYTSYFANGSVITIGGYAPIDIKCSAGEYGVALRCSLVRAQGEPKIKLFGSRCAIANSWWGVSDLDCSLYNTALIKVGDSEKTAFETTVDSIAKKDDSGYKYLSITKYSDGDGDGDGDGDNEPVFENFVRGDVDGNGKVETKDYVLLKRYVLGTYKTDDSAMLVRMNVDEKGGIDSKDYVMLKRVVLGTYFFPLKDAVNKTDKIIIFGEPDKFVFSGS